ncbi:hypothetical protein H0H87_006633 [Tephrocybe sp. NHM501043]|nr:hypothetical protein H0H87_006633 [Tephrocybe sp. NHM501043]
MHENHAETLKIFRERMFEEGILHDGDTVGTDDETLLRFLRARKFDLNAARKMLEDCQEWRKTVEGVGIDELYRRIDPFDSFLETIFTVYVHSMGQLAIVNAPSIFPLIWSMIKPWLSKETAEKVDVLGSDYKDVLLKLIDADCLPSSLGGTCECTEYGGCHKSCPGPWMDGRVGWGPRKDKDSGSASSSSSQTLVERPHGISLKQKLVHVSHRRPMVEDNNPMEEVL